MFAGKKSAQIREILISESAWEEMTCLFAPSLAKVEIERYGDQVQRACDLIRHFEMDLYDNAIVPVALAHRHASISLVPGGQVLNLLVRGGLDTK